MIMANFQGNEVYGTEEADGIFLIEVTKFVWASDDPLHMPRLELVTYGGTAIGGNGADTITGSEWGDVIYAGDQTLDVEGTQADTVYGNGGADLIFGAGLNPNFLYGGEGGDGIWGGHKSDRIRGGNGNDTLTGGGGEDWFTYYEWGYDHGRMPPSDDDKITDFQVSGVDHDVIDFDSSTATIFANFDALMAATTQTAEGALIRWNESSILLENVNKADLTADNFRF
jgi:serralysin